MARLAVPDDSEDLADVHVTAWQRAYRGLVPDEFLDALDRSLRASWWAERISSGSTVHVVEDAGVVGFCAPGLADEPGWGEIRSIYVHPDYWGRGLGRELLSAGLGSLVDDGHDRALLWVLEGNSRARLFYERQGWALGKPFRIEEIGGEQVAEVRYEIEL